MVRVAAAVVPSNSWVPTDRSEALDLASQKCYGQVGLKAIEVGASDPAEDSA